MYVLFFVLVRLRALSIASAALFLAGMLFLASGLGWHKWPLANDAIASGLVGFFGGVLIHRHPRVSALLPLLAFICFSAGGPKMLAAYAAILSAMWVLTHLPATRWPFEHPVLRWLGDRCLSIYLVHFPVQVAIMLLLGDQVPFGSPAFLLGYVATVLAVGHVTYLRIERPAQQALLRMLR
jgi:peptidoglycan/LPS O-acetylase OafA/YrhL